MKECVYAFYPPAIDIWKTYREQPDSYVTECLHRHRNTRFSSNPSALTNTTRAAATSNCQQNTHAGSCNRQFSSDDLIVNTNECSDNEIVLDEKASDSVERRRSQLKSDHKKDGRWADCLVETVYTDYVGIPSSLGRSQTTNQSQLLTADSPTASKNAAFGTETVGTDQRWTCGQQHQQYKDTSVTRSISSTSKLSLDHRRKVGATGLQTTVQPEIQVHQLNNDGGAVLGYRGNSPNRQKPPSPALQTTDKRSKSAMPPCGHTEKKDRRPQRMVKSAAIATRPVGQFTEPIDLVSQQPEETVGVNNPVDYDEQLKKYGWKMEIPGDPFFLKRKCIPKRRPTTVTCEIPVVLPSPPTFTGLDSYETFFHGTLPRNSMSFVVHPDWTSELVVTRRIELQKLDSAMAATTAASSKAADRRSTRFAYPYCTRNFSFIY